MTKTQSYVYLGVLAGALLFSAHAIGASETPAPQPVEPRTVTWLLAHEPADVYARAVGVFADALERESGGTLRLQAVTPDQIGVQGPVGHQQILQLLQNGTVQVSSTYGAADGTNDERFWAWQLPYLLNNYSEMETAFASPAGQQLLDGLSDKAPFRALAYTLSGGFRIFASADKEISSVEDLRGLRIATAGGPVAEAALRAVGAEPVATGLEAGRIGAEDVDAVETTYARLASAVGARDEYTKHIAEADHELFFTTIVADDAFFDSLTPEQQAALTKAVREAAAVERADALALNEQTKAALEAGGTTITVFGPQERAAFKEATKSVYDAFAPILGGAVSALKGE